MTVIAVGAPNVGDVHRRGSGVWNTCSGNPVIPFVLRDSPSSADFGDVIKQLQMRQCTTILQG